MLRYRFCGEARKTLPHGLPAVFQSKNTFSQAFSMLNFHKEPQIG